jgi:hypothetical protein
MKKFLISRLTLTPEAENVLKADAPPAIKFSAAKGLLPLPPDQAVTLQYALLEDPAPEIAAAAEDSLKSYPPNILKNILSGAIHQKIIDWFVRNTETSQELQETIALNRDTADETFALLAKSEHQSVLEIVANNQERYTRLPIIAENLFDNEKLNLALKTRVLSFYHQQHFGVDDKPAAEEKKEEKLELDGGPISLDLLEEEEEEELPEDLQGGLELDGAPEELLSANGEEEQPEEKRVSLMVQINNMNVAAKIKLAFKGNKEARGLLIKDPNRLVASAVANSPKLSDGEVLAIAKSKNVDDEVIRIIARNKEHIRKYQVRLALVQNPKTAFKTALGLLSGLRENDVIAIAKSKNVPPAVAQQAKRMSTKNK